MRNLDSTARDSLVSRLEGEVADFPPVEEPEERPWWAALSFDSDGKRVPYSGEQWSVEDLARSDPALAQEAADALTAATDGADINNRACAVVFADSERAVEALKLLESIPGQSHADANMKLIQNSGFG